ncbi:MAG: hypothetical protein KBD15_03940 [Candidatus Magasanikbacteria bacterium]|nr:hypothetical protein [Candidatus Magasanikbacteria bacterium]
MEYLYWDKKIITDFSLQNITLLYDKGYVFTRTEKGAMDQTRSVRIDLSQFALSSENKRILKKTEGLDLLQVSLPYAKYDWTIGKLAKDFYDTKFGTGVFSANKIKELLTDESKSNFNTLLVYSMLGKTLGYSICFESDTLLHYSYPFYDLVASPKDMGMGMMLRAILHAQAFDKTYIYLGSAQRPSDTYKLQFSGLEWFDGKEWQSDLHELKTILS